MTLPKLPAFIVAAALSLALPRTTPAAPSTDAPPRPNILLIVADDMGFGDVGWHGSEIHTPNIDRLADSGVKLEQFYVQPLCSPTRAALMTGRYPMRYGLQVGVILPYSQYGLSLQERMLPQALRDAGYETAITGKWHLGLFDPRYLPTHRGFDHQYGHYNGETDYFKHTRMGGFDWHRDDHVNHDQGYSTHLIAKEAVRLIESRDTSKPLFLYVPFNAVHAPLQVPDSYKQPYPNIKEPRRTYAGMTAAMDEAIGQILGALDSAHMRDNTLILFTSDNGGPKPGKVTSNGPLRGGKGSLYEGGVRVAACASWAGHLPAGATCNQPLHVVDVYPTLLHLAGADLNQPLPLDGRDAWPTLADNAPSPNHEILINATPFNGAIRVGDWKLVVNGTHTDSESAKSSKKSKGKKANADDADVDTNDVDAPPSAIDPSEDSGNRRLQRLAEATATGGITPDAKMQLFNLATDPDEKHDVAAEHPDKVLELRTAFDKLAAQATPPKNEPRSPGFQVPAIWGEK